MSPSRPQVPFSVRLNTNVQVPNHTTLDTIVLFKLTNQKKQQKERSANTPHPIADNNENHSQSSLHHLLLQRQYTTSPHRRASDRDYRCCGREQPFHGADTAPAPTGECGAPLWHFTGAARVLALRLGTFTAIRRRIRHPAASARQNNSQRLPALRPRPLVARSCITPSM